MPGTKRNHLFLLAPFCSLVVLCTTFAPYAAADTGSQSLGRPAPWKKSSQSPVARESFRSAYSALQHTMSESELQVLSHRSSFDPKDPTVVQLAYRFPTLGLDQIERFAQNTHSTSIQQVAKDPHRYTGQVFHLQGRVKELRRSDLLPEVAAGFEFDHVFLVEMIVDQQLPPLLVVARRVPDAWPRATIMDEPASVYGMLIQTNELDDSTSQLVMIADRVSWHPDRLNAEHNVGKSQLLLSKLGMDLGLFDEVRPHNGRSSIEPECFYQLLAALRRTTNDELRKQAGEFDLAQLLGTPKSQHGNLVFVDGTARRIHRIDIADSYYDQRLGIDHYYAVHVFIPLERPVKLSYGQGNTVEYTRDFPVTIDVLRLPEGLSEGDDINYRVRVPCVYFKLWAYKSQFMAQQNPHQMQLSPLLLGLEPQVVATDRSLSPYVTAGVIGLFVLALGGLWIGLWRTSRKDDEFGRQAVARRFEIEKGKSLNTTGIQQDDQPDFSNLE